MMMDDSSNYWEQQSLENTQFDFSKMSQKKLIEHVIGPFLHIFEINNESSWNKIKSSCFDPDKKIFKFADQFATSKEAFDIITSQVFYEHFNQMPFFFVIIIEVKKLKAFDPLQLENLFEYEKPLMICFECADKQKFTIAFKEANEYEFQIVEDDSLEKLSESEFFIQLRDEFNFGLLLKALHSEICGSFNGKLLQTTVNTQKSFNRFRLIDHAMFYNNILCLRFLQLFTFNLMEENEDEKPPLEIAAKHCDRRGFSALLDLPVDSSLDEFYLTSQTLDLLALKNVKNYSLLMIAVANGNSDAFELLLKFEKDVNHQASDGETASSLAWKNKNFYLLSELIKANSKFPQDFERKLEQHKKHNEKKMKKLCQLLEKIGEFYVEVKLGNDKKVLDLLTSSSFKFIYNINNETSQYVALQDGKVELFALLKSQQGNPHPAETEKINNFIENMSDDLKRRLRDAYKNYHIASEDSYLTDLLNKSRLGMNHDNNPIYFKHVRQAFDELNEIAWIQPILKLVATAPKIDIIFDYHADSVEELDPTQNKSTLGIAYCKSGNIIYIGAKSLLNEQDKFKALGVLAHELTHFAMQMTYNNDCKPYKDEDETTQDKFQEIVKVYESNETEPHVSIVYEYPEEYLEAELIVRVTHLLALYYNNEAKSLKVKQSFGILFKFFRDKTLPDVEKKLQAKIKGKVENMMKSTSDASSSGNTQLSWYPAEYERLLKDEFFHWQKKNKIIWNLLSDSNH